MNQGRTRRSAPTGDKMPRRHIVLIQLGFFLFGLTSCAKTEPVKTAQTPAQMKVSSVSVVRVNPDQVDIPTGGSVEATVRIMIQSGYHINSNPPTYPYLKATELEVKPPEGISVGFISYPNPITKKFAFAEKPLAVYEGNTSVTVLLKASNSVARGAHPVAAKLNIQACDEQVCYPPGTLDLLISVTVK